jgi:hypothetical protein
VNSALELYESRVSGIEVADGTATVHFSHAYIHKSTGTAGRGKGSAWSQEALLTLSEAVASEPLPRLPATISEGFLEVGGIRHELLPLPFKRKVEARLRLVFSDGGELEIVGRRPFVELLGKPIYLEDL